MLRISGFVDDVMFSHNGVSGPESDDVCFVQFARRRHRAKFAVSDCILFLMELRTACGPQYRESGHL